MQLLRILGSDPGSGLILVVFICASLIIYAIRLLLYNRFPAFFLGMVGASVCFAYGLLNTLVSAIRISCSQPFVLIAPQVIVSLTTISLAYIFYSGSRRRLVFFTTRATIRIHAIAFLLFVVAIGNGIVFRELRIANVDELRKYLSEIKKITASMKCMNEPIIDTPQVTKSPMDDVIEVCNLSSEYLIVVRGSILSLSLTSNMVRYNKTYKNIDNLKSELDKKENEASCYLAIEEAGSIGPVKKHEIWKDLKHVCKRLFLLIGRKTFEPTPPSMHVLTYEINSGLDSKEENKETLSLVIGRIIGRWLDRSTVFCFGIGGVIRPELFEGLDASNGNEMRDEILKKLMEATEECNGDVDIDAVKVIAYYLTVPRVYLFREIL